MELTAVLVGPAQQGQAGHGLVVDPTALGLLPEHRIDTQIGCSLSEAPDRFYEHIHNGVLGTRQSGMPGFRIARVAVHGDLIEAARDDASLMLTRDPGLTSPRGEALRTLLYLFERDAAVRILLDNPAFGNPHAVRCDWCRETRTLFRDENDGPF